MSRRAYAFQDFAEKDDLLSSRYGMVGTFDRLILSKWYALVTAGALVFCAGWVLGYLQFRFQIGF